jgi:hypothetical protein
VASDEWRETEGFIEREALDAAGGFIDVKPLDGEERFLATKADRLAGAKRLEKTSAFSARNDVVEIFKLVEKGMTCWIFSGI